MNAVQTPVGMESRILRACNKEPRSRKRWVRQAVALTAAFLLMFGAAWGVPYIAGNTETGQPEVKMSAGLSLNVQAAGGTASEILFPMTGTSEPIETSFLIFDESGLLSGGRGLDFYLKGENIRSVDYRAELGELMCEFESQHIGENGEYIWTKFSQGLETDDYLSYVNDPENPTKEELIAVANFLDEQGKLSYLRDQMGLDSDAAIDYDRIDLKADILYKGDSSATFLRFQNQEKEGRDSVNSVKELLNVASGDNIAWSLPRWIMQENAQKTKEEIDLSGYRETVTITVHYQDGTSETYGLNLEFAQDGTGTATIAKDEAAG